MHPAVLSMTNERTTPAAVRRARGHLLDGLARDRGPARLGARDRADRRPVPRGPGVLPL